MSLELVQLSRDTGLSLATHVWTTTVASQTLLAAPGSGKAWRLHYVALAQSAAVGAVHITANTTAGTNYLNYNQTGPHSELALITLGENEGAYLHAAAGVGAGFIRLYAAVTVVSGT